MQIYGKSDRFLLPYYECEVYVLVLRERIEMKEYTCVRRAHFISNTKGNCTHQIWLYETK